MDLSQISEIFLMIWLLISLPVQITVLFSILKRLTSLKLNKSFFIFFSVNTIIDFLNLFCLVFGIILPEWGWFINFYLTMGSNFGKNLN